MNCHVNGTEINFGELIYADLGYGDAHGKTLQPYILTMSAQEFLRIFTAPFDDFVSSCREVDARFSDIDIPELQDMDYPTLELIFSPNASLLARLLKDYLYFDLLAALTEQNKRSDWTFAINQIDHVEINQAGVQLIGAGYFLAAPHTV